MSKAREDLTACGDKYFPQFPSAGKTLTGPQSSAENAAWVKSKFLPCSITRRLAALATFAFCLAMLPVGPAVAAGEPIEINAVLSMTGSGAFLGAKVAQTLAVVEKTVNASGGVGGRPVKFVIADDASSAANAVQLTTALVGRHVPVMIGPVIVATCAAVLPLVDKSGPQTYCMATPVQAPTGSYMTTQGASASNYPSKALRYFRGRRVHKIALITATDASGQSYERDFNDVMATPEWRGFELVAREHFANSDISIAAQVARIKAAAPDAILSFSVGPSFGTLVRTLYDAGVNVPLVSSAANLNAAQLEPLRSMAPPEVLFIANAGAVPLPSAKGAWKTALARFEKAFEDSGARPELLNTIAWDAAMLTIAGLQKFGPDVTGLQMRDNLLHTRGWTGIYGAYDFNAYPQRGLGYESLVVYRWDAAKDQILTL